MCGAEEQLLLSDSGCKIIWPEPMTSCKYYLRFIESYFYHGEQKQRLWNYR